MAHHEHDGDGDGGASDAGLAAAEHVLAAAAEVVRLREGEEIRKGRAFALVEAFRFKKRLTQAGVETCFGLIQTSLRRKDYDD